MTDQAPEAKEALNLPSPTIASPRVSPDFATILGLVLTIGLIVGAIAISQSDANFINIQSIMIVLLGTLTATSISFTGSELAQSWKIIPKTASRTHRDLKKVTIAMLDLAVISKKKGILGLSQYENQIKNEPYLSDAVQMAVDGYNAKHIEAVLSQDIEAQIERHKRSAGITKKASEVAPTMGLIGTLLGLVQMLADLENPESIGPAMAIALLTTLYGAILGTIIMAPLTAKLEKNSADEALFQTLVMHTAVAIAKQDNPRSLEMQLNAELPPADRVRYFD